MWVAGNVEWTGLNGARNDAGWVGICVTVVAVSEGLMNWSVRVWCFGALLVVGSTTVRIESSHARGVTRPLAEETAGQSSQQASQQVSQQASQQGASEAGLQRFRSIYKELVETNTTLSAGDCTVAAKKMADRLTAAGYPAADMRIFVPEGHPKEGGLIAVLHGSGPNAKAILMLAHVD